MQTFVVDFWARVFNELRWLSLFEIVRRIWPSLRTKIMVDIWVCGHFMLAFLIAAISPIVACSFVKILIVGYGLIRSFEIVMYQTNVLLFDEYRAKKEKRPYKVRGYRRLVILLLHNYAEIIFWFTASYVVLGPYFDFKVQGTANTFFGGLYSSFIVMTTFGDPNIAPKGPWPASLILYQSAIGLFLTLLGFARLISFIPPPESSDEYEQ